MGGIEAVEDISGQEDEVHGFPVGDLADFFQHEFLFLESGVFLESLTQVPVGSMEDFHFYLSAVHSQQFPAGGKI